MARIGPNSVPALAQYRVGNVAQQVGQRLTMPVHGIITDLGGYIRGVVGNGSIDYRFCIWRWDGSVGAANALLGQTSSHSVGPAAVDPGNLTKVTAALVAPVELEAGDTFMVGVSTDTASGSAHQWGIRSSGTHYARDRAAGSAWPVSMSGSYSDARDAAFWVEDYAPVGAAWVRRSGAWVRASSILVRRSGAWVEADTVAVRRSGVWNDAD